MGCMFQVDVLPGPAPTIIGLPPTEGTGLLKFYQVSLLLAMDFETDTQVRLAIGAPGAFRVEDPLPVPIGQRVRRPLQSGDEVASIVKTRGEFQLPVAALLVCPQLDIPTNDAHHIEVPVNSVRIIALPPVGRPSPQVFLSLATDFTDARVRLAIGAPGQFRVDEDLDVPVGRRIVRALEPGDEVASVRHISGNAVGVLLEYELPLIAH
jgi:hypothetical protein